MDNRWRLMAADNNRRTHAHARRPKQHKQIYTIDNLTCTIDESAIIADDVLEVISMTATRLFVHKPFNSKGHSPVNSLWTPIVSTASV